MTVGCAEDAPVEGPSVSEELAIPSMEDYFGGKDDTGYVGNRAFELEASFSGRVQVSVPDKTDEELMALAEELLAGTNRWQHRDITAQVTEQIKYARNDLKSENLNLNLEGGDPTFSSIDVIEGGLELVYTVSIESLVKYKDLEDQQLTIEQLVGRQIEVTLPARPEGLFERVGAACASDNETGGPVDPEDLGAHNLFYYFDAEREGCPLTDGELFTGSYHVESSLDAPVVYPEYDLLVEDGRIDMVVIFGQITHGDLERNDWGWIGFHQFSRSLRGIGFRVVEDFADDMGHRMERTFPGGLVVTIKIYTPVGVADHVPREEANELFRAAIGENEIVYYNGHAFYGSLSVLDDPEVYPADRYQIVMMDACWSYAYYTKQIFRNRATEDDPDGYRLVDVVNNTEPAISGSNQTAVILWNSVFKGAAEVHAGGTGELYSWNNTVEYMNEHAEARAARRTTYPDPEIYGVSGVTTNAYSPNNSGTQPTGTVYSSDGAVDIPDNTAGGASSVIEVPASQEDADSITVRAAIEHTYVADLKVVLSHGDRELVLHDRTGGSSDNLSLNLTTDQFSGAVSGEWTLTVVDSAAIDTGNIASWSIEIP